MPVIVLPNGERQVMPIELRSNPPGPIERRRVAPSSAPVPRTAIASADHMQNSRVNGARRHVEVVARQQGGHARKEVAPVADVVIDQSPLERLADAARRAHEALEEKQVADEAWDVAQAALQAAMDAVSTPAAHEPLHPDIPLIKAPDPAPAASKRQPGRHTSKPGEAQERAARAAKVMDAMVRHDGDQAAVARELGMKPNAVAMVVKHARRRAEGGG